MRLSRLYTPQPLAAGSSTELDEPRSHYLSRVLLPAARGWGV